MTLNDGRYTNTMKVTSHLKWLISTTMAPVIFPIVLENLKKQV